MRAKTTARCIVREVLGTLGVKETVARGWANPIKLGHPGQEARTGDPRIVCCDRWLADGLVLGNGAAADNIDKDYR